MKHFPILGFLLLFLLSYNSTFGQGSACSLISPICVNATLAPNGQTINFNRINASPNFSSFYFFDDGYYSINNNPHDFTAGINGNTFDIDVFSARAYRPTVPSRLSGPITVTMPTSASPPTLTVKRPIELVSSWTAMAGENLIYIIPFTNNTVYPSIDGSVSLDLDPRLSYVNVLRPSNTPNVWSSTSTLSNGNKNISWNFHNLQSGEVRYLYVEVSIPQGVGKQSIVSNASLYHDFNLIASHNHTALVALDPRDPNGIEVDKDLIAPDHPTGQQLRYDVFFTNDGNWYIKDVYVDVTLDDLQHEVPTLDLIETSAPCTITFLNQNTVRFYFKDIYLPGINQSPCVDPDNTPPNATPCNQIFSQDDVTGTFAFNICTKSMLAPGQLSADAVVTFVGVSSIPTDPAITYIEPTNPAPSCDSGGDGREYLATTNNSNNTTALSISDTSKDDKNTIVWSNIYPNPFNTSITIPYEVVSTTDAMVDIRLFSSSGQELESIFHDIQKTGDYNLTYHTQDLAAGVYFVRIQNGATTSTQRIIKLR